MRMKKVMLAKICNIICINCTKSSLTFFKKDKQITRNALLLEEEEFKKFIGVNKVHFDELKNKLKQSTLRFDSYFTSNDQILFILLFLRHYPTDLHHQKFGLP